MGAGKPDEGAELHWSVQSMQVEGCQAGDGRPIPPNLKGGNMDKDKQVEIEILGHKAKIDYVSARQADGIWYKEDFLMVSISFDEEIEGILGFAVQLPVKRYVKDEFMARVKTEAETTLPKLLERHGQEREKQKREQEKKEALDLVVGEIKSEIGLSE